MGDTHPLTLLPSRIQWLHPLELLPQHPWSFLLVRLFRASYPQGSGTLLLTHVTLGSARRLVRASDLREISEERIDEVQAGEPAKQRGQSRAWRKQVGVGVILGQAESPAEPMRAS